MIKMGATQKEEKQYTKPKNVTTNVTQNANTTTKVDNIDTTNLAGVDYQKSATGTPRTGEQGKTFVPETNLNTSKPTEEQKKKLQESANEYNKAKIEDYNKNNPVTQEDIDNVVSYTNGQETITANDYKAKVDNWGKQVTTAGDKVRSVNSNYENGSYGYDEEGYQRYLNDYNRAYSNYDNLVSQKSYYESFNKANWTDYQSEINGNKDRIAELDELLKGNTDAQELITYSAEKNNLIQRNNELNELVKKQNNIQLTMAYDDALQNGNDEQISQIRKMIEFNNAGFGERTIAKVLADTSGVIGNALDVISTAQDVLGNDVAVLSQKASEQLKNKGYIDETLYNDIVNQTQPLIDYTVNDDGVGRYFRDFSNEYSQLANLGASSFEQAGTTIASQALEMAVGGKLLGKMYMPFTSATSGVERYTQLTSNGVDPNLALMNATIHSLANYYLNQKTFEVIMPNLNIGNQVSTVTDPVINSYTHLGAFDMQQKLFSKLAGSKLTQVSFEYLAKASLLVAGARGISSAEVYGIDWVQNSVLEWMGQDTGMSYSAGDMFKNAMTDMMVMYLSTVGRGTFDMAKRTYKINSQQEANQMKADRDLMVQIYNDPNVTPEEASAMENNIASVDEALSNYNSELGQSVILQSDLPDLTTLESAHDTMAKALSPNAEELMAQYTQNQLVTQSVETLTTQQLMQHNIVADAKQFMTSPEEERNKLIEMGDAVGELSGGKFTFQLAPDLKDENGNELPGKIIHNADETEIILVNPNSKEGLQYLANHELYHLISGTDSAEKIMNIIEGYTSKETKNEIAEYVKMAYPELDTAGQKEEYNAVLAGQWLPHPANLIELIQKDRQGFGELTAIANETLKENNPLIGQLTKELMSGIKDAYDLSVRKGNVKKSLMDNLPSGETDEEYDRLMDYNANMSEEERNVIRAKIQERIDYLKNVFDTNEAVTLTLPRGKEIIVTKDIDSPDKYRVSYFEDGKPYQHKVDGSNGIAELVTHENITDVLVEEKGNFAKDTQLEKDNDGNLMSPQMSNYLAESMGDRVDPTDANSPHMDWYSGSPNAIFTVFDNTKAKDYENTNPDKITKAHYFTKSIPVAGSYAGSEEIVDTLNINKDFKTKKELIDNLKKYDLNLGKLDGEYIIYGGTNGLYKFYGGVDSSMGDWFDFLDSIEEVYVNKKNGKLSSIYTDEKLANMTSEEIEQKYNELSYAGYGEKTIEGLLKNVNEYRNKRGIYKAYIKSLNPLIIDMQGKRWNQLPSLGKKQVEWAEPYLPEYNGLKTVKDVNNYLSNLERGYEIYNYRMMTGKQYRNKYKKEIENEIEKTKSEFAYAPKKVIDRAIKLVNAKYGDNYYLVQIPKDSYLGDVKIYRSGKTIEDIVQSPRAISDYLFPIKKIDRFKEMTTTRDYEQYALDQGYDSIRYLNIVDYGEFANSEAEKPTDVLVVFDSSQIKSTSNLKPTNDKDINKAKPLFSTKQFEENSRGVELNKEMIRKAIKEWIPFYEPIRQKYAMLDQKMFDDILSEMFITGSLGDKTKASLGEQLIANDFAGEYSGNSINNVINNIQNDISQYLRHWSYAKDNRNIMQSKSQEKINEMKSFDGTYFAKQWDNLNEEELQTEINKLADRDLETELNKFYYDDLAEDLLMYGKDVRNYRKTLEQNFDDVANGNVELRKRLQGLELDRASAQARQVDILMSVQKVLDNIYNKFGYTPKTEASKYIQYYIEKHSDERRKIDVSTQEGIDELKRHPWEEYTLDDLKKDRPGDWQQIKEAGDMISKIYEDLMYQNIENGMRIYGDVKAESKYEVIKLREKLRLEYETMSAIKDELIKNTTPQLMSDYIKAKKNVTNLVNKYNSLVTRSANGDDTRRQIADIRQNYAHHFNRDGFLGKIKRIFQDNGASTPTYLAGVSDTSRPYTRFVGALTAQRGADYTPDALEGLARYAKDVSGKIAYDPFIDEIRELANSLRAEGKGNTMSDFTTYLDDYANSMTNKRNDIDRAFDKNTNNTFRKLLRVVNAQTKKAVLSFNPRSSLVQLGNLPAGLGNLEERGGKEFVGDAIKGLTEYANSFKNKYSIVDQSPFLNARYFEMNTHESSLTKDVESVKNFMMKALDEVGTKIIWHSAYQQALRKGEKNPIFYADDLARRSVSGREIGEVPITLKSELFNLVFPFQNETNNQWQNTKAQLKGGKWGALLTTQVATFLFNMFIQLLGVRDSQVLPEYITPFIDYMQKAVDHAKEGEYGSIGDDVRGLLLADIAETINMIPGGSQLLNLAMNQDDIENLFGEYNPSRYGVTNLAFSGIGDIISDLGSDNPEDIPVDLIKDVTENYVPGGKQIVKTTEGIDQMINPVVTNDKGNIKYVNDTSNIFNWIEAGLYGPYATKEAQEYYDHPYAWSEKKTKIFSALTDSGLSNEEAKDKIQTEMFGKDNYFSKAESQEFVNELKDNGMWDDYYDFVKNQFDESGETDFYSFASKYGLNKSVIKGIDKYDDLYETYEMDKDTQKSFQEAMDIEATYKDAEGNTYDKKPDGIETKKVTNSEGLKQRKAMMENGTWDDYYEWAVKTNRDTNKEDNITKTVFNATDDEFQKLYEKQLGGN